MKFREKVRMSANQDQIKFSVGFRHTFKEIFQQNSRRSLSFRFGNVLSFSEQFLPPNFASVVPINENFSQYRCLENFQHLQDHTAADTRIFLRAPRHVSRVDNENRTAAKREFKKRSHHCTQTGGGSVVEVTPSIHRHCSRAGGGGDIS